MTLRLWPVCLLALAYARPPAEPTEQPGGLALRGVKIEAWRGDRKTFSGSAPRVSLQRNTFEAADATLKLESGTRVDAPVLQGDDEGARASAPQGGTARTADGCVATTKTPARYDGHTVQVDGALSVDGCGVALTAQGMRYAVGERKADLDGPVETHVEARR
jgi:hypothetical protein